MRSLLSVDFNAVNPLGSVLEMKADLMAGSSYNPELWKEPLYTYSIDYCGMRSRASIVSRPRSTKRKVTIREAVPYEQATGNSNLHLMAADQKSFGLAGFVEGLKREFRSRNASPQDVLDLANSDGDTALSLAVEMKNIKAAEVLLRAGSSPLVCNSVGDTAFLRAVKTEDWGFFSILFPTIRDLAGPTEFCKTLLMKNHDGLIGVHYAAFTASVELFRAVLEVYTDHLPKDTRWIGTVDDMKNTMLHSVCARWRSGDSEVKPDAIRKHAELTIAKELIKLGVEVDATNSRGMTALHVAASNGKVHLVKYLLSAGADINALCLLRLTPVEYALKCRHLNAFELLIGEGGLPGDKVELDQRAKRLRELRNPHRASAMPGHKLQEAMKGLAVSVEGCSSRRTPLTPEVLLSLPLPGSCSSSYLRGRSGAKEAMYYLQYMQEWPSTYGVSPDILFPAQVASGRKTMRLRSVSFANLDKAGNKAADEIRHEILGIYQASSARRPSIQVGASGSERRNSQSRASQSRSSLSIADPVDDKGSSSGSRSKNPRVVLDDSESEESASGSALVDDCPMLLTEAEEMAEFDP